MRPTWTITPLAEGAAYSSSSTLLSAPGVRIIVDTGLSLQEDELRGALGAHGLGPDDIDLVFNTHLHVDHCGNNAMFPRARIVLSRAEWTWTDAFYTAIFTSRTPERAAVEFYPELPSHQLKPRMIRNVARLAKLFWRRERLGDERRFCWIEDWTPPEGVVVLPTPGHTPHHVSLRVAAVGGRDVIVAGDAVLNEDPAARTRTMVPYARAQFAATREALLALGLPIVPGHGPAFDPAHHAVSMK